MTQAYRYSSQQGQSGAPALATELEIFHLVSLAEISILLPFTDDLESSAIYATTLINKMASFTIFLNGSSSGTEAARGLTRLRASMQYH